MLGAVKSGLFLISLSNNNNYKVTDIKSFKLAKCLHFVCPYALLCEQGQALVRLLKIDVSVLFHYSSVLRTTTSRFVLNIKA